MRVWQYELDGNANYLNKNPMSSPWTEAQHFEQEFWGNSLNTISEELKQQVYARHMGLEMTQVSAIGMGYDLKGKRILDIGGGPVSSSTPAGFPFNSFDEVWIYNVLQHTEDPAKIIANAKRLAPSLRMFEWIDLPAYPGHPQALTQAKLEDWIGMQGQVSEQHGEGGCWGRAFHGCFNHASHNP
jgi:hypothetical protein